MNPSDDYLTGFPTVSRGIFIPAGYFKNGVYTNSAVPTVSYNTARTQNYDPTVGIRVRF